MLYIPSIDICDFYLFKRPFPLVFDIHGCITREAVSSLLITCGYMTFLQGQHYLPTTQPDESDPDQGSRILHNIKVQMAHSRLFVESLNATRYIPLP